jgi:hypothetical protein
MIFQHGEITIFEAATSHFKYVDEIFEHKSHICNAGEPKPHICNAGEPKPHICVMRVNRNLTSVMGRTETSHL